MRRTSAATAGTMSQLGMRHCKTWPRRASSDNGWCAAILQCKTRPRRPVLHPRDSPRNCTGLSRPRYRPRVTSTAARTRSSFARDSFPTRSVRRLRSRVTSWVAFATESLGSPEACAVSSTQPGASAHPRLLVNGTQTTVLRRLRLRASLWTTTTGRRNPGADPVGAGRSAHHTSPWAITSRSARESFAPPQQRKRLAIPLPHRRRDPSPR